MTAHFRPEEFVDALDGLLEPARLVHLDACESCRAQLEDARAALSESAASSIPEPSPLFWDHFSARVHEATQSLEATPRRWWEVDWRPVAAVATAAAALAMVLVLRPGSTTLVEPAAIPTIADDGSWDVMLGMASEATWEDLREAAAPVAGTADAAIQELTSAEREALVRLLKKEIGKP